MFSHGLSWRLSKLLEVTLVVCLLANLRVSKCARYYCYLSLCESNRGKQSCTAWHTLSMSVVVRLILSLSEVQQEDYHWLTGKGSICLVNPLTLQDSPSSPHPCGTFTLTAPYMGSSQYDGLSKQQPQHQPPRSFFLESHYTIHRVNAWAGLSVQQSTCQRLVRAHGDSEAAAAKNTKLLIKD